MLRSWDNKTQHAVRCKRFDKTRETGFTTKKIITFSTFETVKSKNKLGNSHNSISWFSWTHFLSYFLVGLISQKLENFQFKILQKSGQNEMLLDSSAIKPGICNGFEIFLHRRTRNIRLNTSEKKNLIRQSDFLAYRVSHSFVHFSENRAKLGKLNFNS